MRRPSLYAAALFLLIGFCGSAQACMSFDRVAEMRLIDDAIASRGTSEVNRAELVAFRDIMLASTGYESKNVVSYHNAATRALRLIGKERIVRYPANPLFRSAADTKAIVPRHGCG